LFRWRALAQALAQSIGVTLPGLSLLAHSLHFAQELPHRGLGRLAGGTEHGLFSLPDCLGQPLQCLCRRRILQLGSRCQRLLQLPHRTARHCGADHLLPLQQGHDLVQPLFGQRLLQRGPAFRLAGQRQADLLGGKLHAVQRLSRQAVCGCLRGAQHDAEEDRDHGQGSRQSHGAR